MLKHGDARSSFLYTIRTFCPRSSTTLATSDKRAVYHSRRLYQNHLSTSTRRTANTPKPTPNLETFPKPSTIHARAQWQDPQHGDIVQGDLNATLEAHRTSAKDRFFRRVETDDLNDTLDEPNVHVSPPDKKPKRGKQGYKRSANDPANPKSSSGHILDASGNIRDAQRRVVTLEQFHAKESHPEESTALLPTSEEHGNISVSNLERATAIISSQELRRIPPVEPPWETEETANMLDPRQRLNAEIANFAKWAVPDDDERQFYKLVAAQECDYMNSILPELDFELVGSHRVGLATATSDIDIAFGIKKLREQKKTRGPSPSLSRRPIRTRINKKLVEIRGELAQTERFEDFNTVFNGSFPLVQARYRGAETDFQFVYSNNSTENDVFVRSYIELYPQLLPIYVLVKSALQAAKLTEPSLGGLGSYPLLLMIIASFRIRKLSDRDDLVQALMEFLSFYTEFDSLKHCISVEPACVFDKVPPDHTYNAVTKREMLKNPAFAARIRMSYQSKRGEADLVLQDPNDFGSNATRRCIAFPDIKSVLWTFQYTCLWWLDPTFYPERGAVVHPLERMVSEAVYPIDQKRFTLKHWLTSDAGRAQMESMAEQYGSVNLDPRPMADVNEDTMHLLNMPDSGKIKLA